MSGWIKLHRQMTEWEWFDDHNTFRLFTYLLMTVNHKEKKWQGNIVPAGSIITGRHSLSEKTGLSERSIRTSLSKLKSTNEVTIKTSNKFSIISITNWERYQASDQQNDQQATSKRPASDQQATTTKECKKDKNVKNKIDFDVFYSKYPKKVDKKNAKKKWDSLTIEKQQKAIDGIAKFVSGKESQFICSPTVYMNGERWDDESPQNGLSKNRQVYEDISR